MIRNGEILSPTDGFFAGVDIGGTNVRIGILEDSKEDRDPDFKFEEDSDELFFSEPLEMPQSKIDDEESLMEEISGYLRDENVPLSRLYGIGIGAPGKINREELRIEEAANVPTLDFRGHSIDGSPVYLENDVAVAAIGEFVRGHGQDYNTTSHVQLSTGIGGGVIINSQLKPENNPENEIGFTQVDSSFDRETYGKRNVWEAYASGPNMPDFFLEYCMEKHEEDILDFNPEEISVEDIFELYEQGDEIAEEFLETELARINASGIGNVLDSYSPELVTFGGGIALNNPYIIDDHVKQYIEDYAVHDPEEIKIAQLGENAGIYGAAQLPKIRAEEGTGQDFSKPKIDYSM